MSAGIVSRNKYELQKFMRLKMINAWAVEILDENLGDGPGYRFADIKRTESDAVKLSEKLGGRVVPLHDFDWNDAQTPFFKL